MCKKLTNLNRKPFDSGKQRAVGSDISYADVKRVVKEKEKVGVVVVVYDVVFVYYVIVVV